MIPFKIKDEKGENSESLFPEILDNDFDFRISEKIRELIDSTEKEDELNLEKARVAYHEHDGYQEHPVRVKYHNEYFAEQRETALDTKLKEFERTVSREYGKKDLLQIELGKEYLSNNLFLTDAYAKQVNQTKQFDPEWHKKNQEKVLSAIEKYNLPFGHIERVKQITFDDGHKTLAGIHNKGHITLYNFQRTDDFEDAPETFVHELGHAVHSSLSNAGHDEFDKIWIDAKVAISNGYTPEMLTAVGFPTRYSTENIFEYFAECYLFYFTNREYLRKINPKIVVLFDREFKK